MKWTLGLNFYADKVKMFNPLDLHEKKIRNSIKADRYHIYLICKRKKFYFERSKPNGEVNVTTLYYLDDQHNKQFVDFTHPGWLKVRGFEGRHYNIEKYAEEGTLRDFEFVSLLSYYEPKFGDSTWPSDLEVMYVGQAFGRKQKKMIDYRILKHEKIQKIALDIIDKGSNEEVLVIGVRIATRDLATSLMELGSNAERPTVDSLNELRTKARKRISEGQEVTVFEASLIRYFQPEYNSNYKETFPSVDYPSYEEIYNTDFAYTSISLVLDDVFTRLFSRHISDRSLAHQKSFPLTSADEKRTLFEYLYDLR